MHNSTPMARRLFVVVLVISMAVLLFSPASGQITTPCTPAMVATFTPCMNFVTNSSLNGTSPTADCCSSLKSLMNVGRDCLCLITTAGIPFQVPINQNLAISLPRACNMPGVPFQCKATGSPVPAPTPGPKANRPTPSPYSASPPSGEGFPEPLSPSLAPEVDASPSPPGNRAGVTPSSAYMRPSCTASSVISVAFYGAIVALRHH